MIISQPTNHVSYTCTWAQTHPSTSIRTASSENFKFPSTLANAFDPPVKSVSNRGTLQKHFKGFKKSDLLYPHCSCFSVRSCLLISLPSLCNVRSIFSISPSVKKDDQNSSHARCRVILWKDANIVPATTQHGSRAGPQHHIASTSER